MTILPTKPDRLLRAVVSRSGGRCAGCRTPYGPGSPIVDHGRYGRGSAWVAVACCGTTTPAQAFTEGVR